MCIAGLLMVGNYVFNPAEADPVHIGEPVIMDAPEIEYDERTVYITVDDHIIEIKSRLGK